MSIRRIVIFSGGNLGEWAVDELRQDDLLVGADRGSLFLVQHGLKPRISLGDFDSVSAAEYAEIERISFETISCDPVMKDFTDTEMAVDWAIKQRSEEIVIIGALGTRFDHSLANVHLLSRLLQHGIRGKIIDSHNEITLIERGIHTVVKGRFSRVSLLPLSMTASGITLAGFLYPLNDATLTIGETIGISNSLVGQSGTIQLGQGNLLVIQSID